MNRARHFFFLLWMAFALVAGQHAVALHDLSHVADPAQKQDSTPGKTTCDKCFACAQLSGAIGASIPAVPLVDAARALALSHADKAVASAPLLAFHSRAPPAFL